MEGGHGIAWHGRGGEGGGQCQRHAAQARIESGQEEADDSRFRPEHRRVRRSWSCLAERKRKRESVCVPGVIHTGNGDCKFEELNKKSI